MSVRSGFAESRFGIDVENRNKGINHGLDKIRFLIPVCVGKRIGGRTTLSSPAEKRLGEFPMRQPVTVEIYGANKPAVVAEWLTMSIVCMLIA